MENGRELTRETGKNDQPTLRAQLLLEYIYSSTNLPRYVIFFFSRVHLPRCRHRGDGDLERFRAGMTQRQVWKRVEDIGERVDMMDQRLLLLKKQLSSEECVLLAPFFQVHGKAQTRFFFFLIFKNKFIYLFIFGCVGSGSCGPQARALALQPRACMPQRKFLHAATKTRCGQK